MKQNMQKQLPKFLNYILPSFPNLLWMAGFFGVLLRGRRMINADGDLLLHLNLGKYILNTGRIPLQDVFSHTMTGQPVTQHEWLSAVIFESINRLFGLNGIIIFSALVISTTLLFVMKNAQRESVTLLPVLFSVLFTFINTEIHWMARPHILSFLTLTIWINSLTLLRNGNLNRWWVLPILMLVWVNLHGGFIIGFITWVIYGVGIAWDHNFYEKKEVVTLVPRFWTYYVLSGLTSLCVSLINPSGFGLWIKVLSHVGNKFLANITHEFQSPNFHEITFWPFMITIGLIFIILGFSKKKFKSELLFNAAAWLMMSLYSIRNIPFFGIITAPILAGGLDDLLINANPDNKLNSWLKGMDARLQILNNKLKGVFWPLFSVFIAILGLSIGINFDIDGQGYALDPEVFPIAAVDWLIENPQDGNMFNYFTWGGYLEYRLWPEKQVFIDSKSDFFGEEFVRQYTKVIFLQDDWESVLDKLNVQWAILPPNTPASTAIKSDLGWKAIYKDETAVILLRP